VNTAKIVKIEYYDMNPKHDIYMYILLVLWSSLWSNKCCPSMLFVWPSF